MKLPVQPAPFDELLARQRGKLNAVFSAAVGPEVRGEYAPWDKVRHLDPPAGLDHEAWWLGIKLARRSIARPLPLRDKQGRNATLAVTDAMQRRLHFIDREAAGSIHGLDRSEGPRSGDRYLVRSLIEEAMTSAQLEGASTTREVAKELLRTGRAPRDVSERMIFNNYAVMQQLRDWQREALTPTGVFEIHRRLTADTLQDPEASGRFRRAGERVVVMDNRDGTVLHDPPPASELPARLEALCAFANENDGDTFLHPALRAIALHFQLAYDHPFVDGNGRTARALFYWSMLRSGYWLTEYLSISSVLRAAPSQYARAFLLTETDESDLGYFVCHQLEVLEKAVDGLRGYLARKSTERSQAEALLKPGTRLAARLNHRQRALLLDAIRQPHKLYTIAGHQGTHAVTYATARSDLLDLAAAKLLKKRMDGKAFVFQPAANLASRLDVSPPRRTRS